MKSPAKSGDTGATTACSQPPADAQPADPAVRAASESQLPTSGESLIGRAQLALSNQWRFRSTEGSEITPTRIWAAQLVLAVALLGLLGAAAPTAHADAVDDAFIAALKAKGINVASPKSAIIAGHVVCDQLDLGRQPSDVATDVTKNSNLDGYHAGYFVGASIAAYCSKHAS